MLKDDLTSATDMLLLYKHYCISILYFFSFFFQCSLSKFSLPEVPRASIQQLFKIIHEKYISERDVYSTLSVFFTNFALEGR